MAESIGTSAGIEKVTLAKVLFISFHDIAVHETLWQGCLLFVNLHICTFAYTCLGPMVGIMESGTDSCVLMP